MTGIQAFAQERYEEIFIHGFTTKDAVENPEFYDKGQLVQAAEFCLHPYRSDTAWPENWDTKYIEKILLKNDMDRLRVAGALLAAEYDRLKYISEHKIVEESEVAKDFKELDPSTEFPVSEIDSLPFVETFEEPLSLEYKDGEVKPEIPAKTARDYVLDLVWVDVLRGFQVMYAVYSHGANNIGFLSSKITPLKMRYDDGERTPLLLKEFNDLEERLLEEPEYKDSHYYKEYRHDKS